MDLRIQIAERLKWGEIIENYREPGNSMTPIIASREPVTLAPVDPEKLEKGDIVFAKVRGNFYTHRVNAVRKGAAQIANNHGHINGWTPLNKVYGIVIEINGRPISGVLGKMRKPE